MRSVRRLLAVVTLVATVAAATACTDLQGTEGKTWITGEGRIETTYPGERGKAADVQGEDLDGEPLDLADYRGKVVVLNVYASWCGPCRAEMPTVVDLAGEADPDDVVWIGINIRDDTSAARSFGEAFGVDFRSFDDPSSAVLLALSDDLGPRSLPSTVVLDREGRLAAQVLGQIPGVATFREVVAEVVAEDG